MVRLLLFLVLMVFPVLAQRPPASKPVLEKVWNITITQDPMDNSKQTAFVLLSADKNAALHVECQRATDGSMTRHLYVSTAEYLDQDRPMELKIDDAEVQKPEGNLSTDYKAYFIHDRKLIPVIFKAKSVMTRLYIFQGNSMLSKFSIPAIDMQKVNNSCGYSVLHPD